MVQLNSKNNEMMVLPSWMPFISKNPQLMLTTTECMDESNHENDKNDNVFTVQNFLNTLALSDQFMHGQLKDHKDKEDGYLKNTVTEHFWIWTFQICWFIRDRYLKEFELETINAYENENNHQYSNIIHLSTPELAALTNNHSNNDEDTDYEQDTILEILNLHKNLCLELSKKEKDSHIDDIKKIFFLWWFMTYNLLKVFNKRLNLYTNDEFERIIGNGNESELNEKISMNAINFTYATHSGFDYFPNDLLSFSKNYLGTIEEDNVILLFFKDENDFEHHTALFNELKSNNMNFVPMTIRSLTTKMQKGQFDKEKSAYESIKECKDINEFTITKQLGKGSSGFVRNAIHKKTGTKVIIKYVVKSLILRGCWSDSRSLAKFNVNIKCSPNTRRFPNEIAVLQYIHDELNGNVPDNLTTLITYWEDSFYYYLVFANTTFDSDLFDYIDKSPNGTMPESEAKTIFKNVLDAVQILHHNNIVHRDIKDENVLINYKTKEIQLIDFGSSTFYDKDQKLTNFVGSFLFAAPEIIKGMSYEGPQQDIWSLGILLYTMIYKVTPFNDYYEILRNNMKFPQEISKECKELILWMTNRDITKRPTIDQVLSHPWLN